MTVREYIGARYVPLFMGEWSIDSAYEPLSIVQYQGASYTSRQAVPSGIQITDETYWAITGNYNAQIEAYRQEVRAYDGRITTNANDISDLRGDFEEFETATDSRLDNIEDSIETDIGDIETRIFNPYKGTKSIGFGDSNMYGQTFDDESKCIYHQITDYLECTYDNHGVNGARFDTGYSNNIMNQITAANADEDVRLVVFIGGINDYHYSDYNYANFMGWIRTTVNAAIAKYPNADFLLIWDQGQQLPNSHMLRYAQAMDELKRLFFPGKNIIVPRTFDLAYGGSYYYFNQNHMNAIGCSIIAQRATDALLGHQNSRAFVYRDIATNTDIASSSKLRAISILIPDLDSFTVMQNADIYIDQNVAIDTTFSTVLQMPIGLSGNTAGGAHNFYGEIFDRAGDGTWIGLNYQQPDSNYESVTDSPTLNLRFVRAHTFGANTHVGFSVPLMPQD